MNDNPLGYTLTRTASFHPTVNRYYERDQRGNRAFSLVSIGTPAMGDLEVTGASANIRNHNECFSGLSNEKHLGWRRVDEVAYKAGGSHYSHYRSNDELI